MVKFCSWMHGEIGVVDANEKLFEAAGECEFSQFESRMGQSFLLKPLDAPDVEYEFRLTETTQHPAQVISDANGKPKRIPFSLLFKPVDEQAPPISGLHTIYDGSKAWMIIFVTPVTTQSDGAPTISLESVFT